MGVTVLGIQHRVALRKESVDRNVLTLNCTIGPLLSLSARRAWIEILCGQERRLGACVALRKESVDRNLVGSINRAIDIIVALRKESVDRNQQLIDTSKDIIKSLSARRAWIEIIGPLIFSVQPRSLSARRAWIEISNTVARIYPH